MPNAGLTKEFLKGHSLTHMQLKSAQDKLIVCLTSLKACNRKFIITLQLWTKLSRPTLKN